MLYQYIFDHTSTAIRFKPNIVAWITSYFNTSLDPNNWAAIHAYHRSLWHLPTSKHCRSVAYVESPGIGLLTTDCAAFFTLALRRLRLDRSRFMRLCFLSHECTSLLIAYVAVLFLSCWGWIGQPCFKYYQQTSPFPHSWSLYCFTIITSQV